jgi:subtilisin
MRDTMRGRAVWVLVASLIILVAMPALVGAQTTRERVLIGFADMPEPADAAAVQAAGGVVRASYQHLPMLAAEVPSWAIAGLERNPRVTYVEPDQVREAIAQTLPWGVDHIDADLAWATARGAGVKLAILDTGGDYDHPDLHYAGGVNYYGSRKDGSTAPADWNDGNGHGTWTSGIAAALDNGIGVVGVAPDVSLYAVKVLSNSGMGWDSDIAQGIDWAIGHGINVISMSLGGSGYSAGFADACQRAWDAGIVLVAAAGNEGDGNPATEEISYPAAFPSVIAVGATTQSDGLASFSNTGSYLELTAPGVSIYSTYKGGGYATYSGTSASCPHVAGVAALVLSASPGASNAQVRTLLEGTARDLGPAGWDPGFGYGLVDAYAAVGAAASPVQYDAAVTAISAPDSAVIGDLVQVAVTVANTGTDVVSFDVSLAESPDGTAFPDQSVLNLAPGDMATLTFDWDTTGYTAGSHTLLASALLAGDEQPANDSQSTQVTLTTSTPPAAGLDITVTTDKASYQRRDRVYITVSATDGGSPPVALADVYNLVEVVAASGNIYIGEGYTGSDGTSVYWFSPKPKDGYGTYNVLAYGDNGVYVDTDTTTFTVTR